MTELSLALEKFVTMRSSLGRISKQDVRILKNFVEFMRRAGLTVISSDAFLAWRQSIGGASGITWAMRLGLVRQFAEWLVARGESHSVPPKGLIPRKYQRPRPYIYSQEEIRRLIIACQNIRSQRGVMSLVMPVFIGLIAATGMRISEAMAPATLAAMLWSNWSGGMSGLRHLCALRLLTRKYPRTRCGIPLQCLC